MVPQRQASSVKVYFKYSRSSKFSTSSMSRATDVSHCFATDLTWNVNLGRKAQALYDPDDRMQRLLQESSDPLVTMQETLQNSTSNLLAMQQSLTKIDDKLEALKMLEAPIQENRLDAPCHVNLVPRHSKFYGRKDVLKRMTQELLPPNQPDRPRSFAVSGTPGVGKTRSALGVVRRDVNRFKAVF